MSNGNRRNVLLPWFIGIAILVVADLWIAYRMFSTGCPASGIVEAIVVIVIPIVYLALMYVTLKSQA
jgi:hypothetical protein